jgi:acyl carrier protein
MEDDLRLRRDDILRGVIELVDDMTEDWEGLEDVRPVRGSTTLMADHEFTSIDVVMLIVGIEDRFERRDLPFEELLMVDGRYVDDLTIDQVVSFLAAQLTRQGA